MFRNVVSVGSFVVGQSPQCPSRLCRIGVSADQSPQFPMGKREFNVKSGILYEGSLRVVIMEGLFYGLFLKVIGGIYSP